MGRRRFLADVPEGTHLGVSHESNGAYRGHLFDDKTNKLVGHVELEEDDEYDEYDEYDLDDDDLPAQSNEPEVGGGLAGLAFLGVMIGAVAGVNYLHKRHQESKAQLAATAPPMIQARTERGLPPPPPQPRVVAAPMVTQAPTTQVAVSRPEDTISMSRDEWQERVRAMLLARAFSEDQQRILSHARIVDADPEMLEWQRAFDSLTPQQFSQRITLMLEANPALLTEAEARFLALFGPGRAPERERVLVQAATARAIPAASAVSPAGWYDDRRGAMRWWNGQVWTEHVQPPRGYSVAGWYPAGVGWLRWWDGRQWTVHVAPVPGEQPR